ncbi:terminase small subunit [Clostridium perfringens]|uniref:terminase small subunit n=1 Tax=Clostridium perfringens TaxID=1502 RepID=UPI0024685FCE|nr:terminase small subunit [Clostridium perfringens]EHK2402053.1 terminase small subunit [Clostridium perfringens]MDH5076096.1 Terminase small subunit [Clostridium perfringens]
MARARSPNRDKAFEIYKNHDGNIKLIDIAKELKIKDSQIRKWKSQDNWDEKLKGALPISKGNATNQNENKTNIKKDIKEPIAEDVKEVLENTELTDKQRLFCIYYIKRFNATKAYQKAYQCSYETALVNGPRLLGNARIQEEVQSLKEGKLNKIMLSEEDIFQKYMDIAFSDIGDYLSFKKVRKNKWTKNKEGEDIPVVNPDTGQQDYFEYNVVELNNSKELDTSILQEVSEGKDGVKIKLQDKMKALQWLSDHMNIATDKQKAELEVLKSRIVKDNSKNNTNSTAKLDSILGQIKERNKNE